MPVRTLCLCCSLHPTDFNEVLPNTSLLPIPIRFPSPSLTHIEIILGFSNGLFTDMAVVNWPELDAQLTHMAHGTSLAQVVILVGGY